MGDHHVPPSVHWRRRAAVALLMILASSTIALASPRPGDTPCPAWMRLDVPLLEPMINGSAWDPKNRVLWPREAYFEVEGETVLKEDSPQAYVVCPCNAAGPGSQPCLRKCCPLHQAMSRSSRGCVSHKAEPGEPWLLPVKRDIGEGVQKPFFIFHGAEDKCESGGKILLKDEDFILRFRDGSLFTENGTKMHKPGSFCLDYFVDEDRYRPILCHVEDVVTLVDAVTRATNSSAELYKDRCEEAQEILYPMGLIISIILLSISLFVHAYIRDLRNLRGKCLMCHISSLLTTYIFISIVLNFEVYGDDSCIAAGFIIYFSLLSAILWLNSMCIDMYITFSSGENFDALCFFSSLLCLTNGMRSMAGSNQEAENRKFVMYALYSWGIPSIILMITCIMEFGPVPDYFLKPVFEFSCWFENNSSEIVYFIAPVGLIIACNILLFILTARKIYTLKRDTRVLQKGESKRHQSDGDDSNQRFMLYLKLFIAMGVNWSVMLIINMFIDNKCILIPFDFLFTLQGVFVFYIFVWKNKICRKLTKTLCRRLAAKLKFMVPNTTLNLDCGTSSSTVSSNLVSSCIDDSKFKLDTVSSRVSETTSSGEVTTVT
ncbi:probable G-protein coupled receptor Mth-like 3 [Ischnura elegans]|uniref:probable G-protein coupled receptor Mth-like 3 n=1 Tax=Ischnura elegans TaxID=197161 RepID=UPI001ED891F6|nr:probable G-protein coupled receptor Mth-like 3 [Ischnura elegans]